MKRKRNKGVCVACSRSIEKNSIDTSYIYYAKHISIVKNDIKTEEIVVYKHYI